ncbi:uncharacterized protein LOC122007479 [Zingiber officinale]|uniref:uncharacterized protein LOC122007479 n=1 Tax=Zingiber officinale TaxID=94328 RepID=UPI001C4CD58B|nr:uncharacterized protein LOC122007479 [Zingiber officinale]
MTPKEGTDLTPFHLVYGGEVVVPVEIGVESDQVLHYDEGNDERRQMELDMIDEARDKAAARLVGDLVWKRVKPVGDVKKLETPWAGSFKVVEKLQSGACYLEDAKGRRLDQP